MQPPVLASVRSGMILNEAADAAITFDVDGRAVTLAFSAAEVTGLVSVCAGLAAQAAARGGAVQVLDVDDWQVGRTSSEAVVMRLASPDGAALTYRLARPQALELRNAITLATAHPPRETAHAQAITERAPPEAALQMAELVELRERRRHDAAALQTIDRCLALVAELDAANDEGRVVFLHNLIELVCAAKAHLISSEDHAEAGPLPGVG